ncbi:dna polymerase v family and armadillo-type fold domain-containing protein [Diplodia corticola]|uniref:Dna polymerase v family and armadillo-type fold domain-containing protein n=1 Tax=Diplodia corticola TaxID=236234 RepID=A0A1J9SB29_9PEZI|nr:dna polymerase v family and armadillo-type fold domain-containing protein [Diplodia corticola]OJD37695.1 dna polymerase v family and armadillo-type fold domain-containing protein [Diplodia corticola]
MDSFESQNAAEWQSVTRKKKNHHSSRPEPPSSHPSRVQPQHRTHAPTIRNAGVTPTVSAGSSAPALNRPRPAGDVLIDLASSDEQPTRKTPINWSNPFASLAFGEPASPANSAPIRNRHDKQHVSGGSTVNGTLIQKIHSRRTSSNLDDLIELDPSFSQTPSSAGLPTSPGESAITDGPPRQSSTRRLDEDVPLFKREEDEAWFKAQSDKDTAPAMSQTVSGNTYRHHFERPGQLIYPVGMPATPSYRGRASSQTRGDRRGHSRDEPRSRGGQHTHGERRESRSHVSQRSSQSYSGSEGTPGTAFQQSRGKSSTRGHGYSPRGSHGLRGRSTHTDFSSVAMRGNSSSIRKVARESPCAMSDWPEETSLAAKVVGAIESDEKVQSLAVYHDTTATTEWRKKGMRPGRVFALPKHINLAGQSFDKNSSSKPAIARPAEIAMITNTHIDQVWGPHKQTKTAKLLIYGSDEAVTEAVKLIIEWLREIEISARAGGEMWAKVWGYNPKAERKLRKRLLRDEERRKYRQTISEGEVLAHSAHFIWPLPKEPEQVLGMNFEALDPIRMNCECYITCERSFRTILKIQGNVEQKVKEAADRLQCLPVEWDAKRFEAEPFVILDTPYAFDPDDLPPVSMVPYRFPRQLAAHPASTHDAFTFRFQHKLQQHQAPYAASEDSPAGKLLEAVVNTTKHARYFRNFLKLHLHLGTFAARKYFERDINETTYSFPVFAEMMEEPDRMDAKVSKEIGDPIVERHILTRCFESSHILAPQDAWTLSLSDVQPVYCATFEIANPAGQAGDFILDVELVADASGTDIVSKSWSQLAKGKSEPCKLLDGSIISLENGGLAWNLEMEEYMTVDERGLSPDYHLFPNTLRLDTAAANDLTSGHDFIVYRRSKDRIVKVPIKSVRQKRCWRFNTIGSMGEWVVEVAHVGKTTIGNDGQQIPYEPRWTFNVFNNSWDKLLTSNSRTEIGRAAKWGSGDSANLLFPMNPDNSALSGVAQQDDEVSSEGSEAEDDNRLNDADPEELDNLSDEPPSLQNFEQLLDLLRALTNVAVGKPHSRSSTDRANEFINEA